MRATAEKLVQAFNGTWDEQVLEAAMVARAPECVHYMLPRSLGFPAQNNEQWTAHFRSIIGTITDSKVSITCGSVWIYQVLIMEQTTINDIVVAPEERRVVIHSSVTASATVGRFSNEYVWFFTFDQEGQKITRIDEMMDSAAVKDLYARRAKAKEESGK